MICTSTVKHWARVDNVPAHRGPTVVVLGVFDGLHRGHAHLLSRARARATSRGIPLVLVTFDPHPHPATVAGPARDTTAIATVEQRVRLARRHGVDHVLVLRFDECLAAVPAEEFVRTVLVERLGAVDVVVGESFRFGRGGHGDVELLRRLGSVHGFGAHGVKLLPGCSSTRIRSLVAAGDLPGVSRILGRSYRLEGWVVTIRPDRSVWVHDRPDGPITVGLVRAA